MKLMGLEIECLQFLLGHLDPALVCSPIQTGFDDQPGLGRRSRDEIHDGTVVGQGPASPVRGDERKEAMLNLVPLAGARRKVTYRDRQLLLGRKSLELSLPQMAAVAIASAAVGADQKMAGLRVAGLAHVPPPLADALHGELGGVPLIPTLTQPLFSPIS